MALMLPVCVVLDMLYNLFEPARIVGRIRDYRHKEKHLMIVIIIFISFKMKT